MSEANCRDKSHSPSPARTNRSESSNSDWELIPDYPQPPEEHKHLIPPTTSNQPKLLCGFLKKETTHSLIKTWKSRWVVIDDERQSLYYYNAKTDTVPQGSIDLSNVTFNYSIENNVKNQFEIRSQQNVYCFQAPTQEAMFQWLEALKKKRKKFSNRVKKGGGTLSRPQSLVPGGLMGMKEEEEESLEVSNGQVGPITQPPPGSSPDTQLRRILRLPKKMLSSPNPPPPPQSSDTNTNRRSNFYVSFNKTDVQLEEDKATSSSETDLTKVDPDTPTKITRKKPDWIRRFTSDGFSCPKCAEYQRNIDSLEHDLSLKEREVKDRDEILEFLRSEIRLSDLQDKVRKELSVVSDGNKDVRIDVLTQRDQLINSLQKTMELMRIENEKLESDLRDKKDQCAKLNEEIVLFKETISAKDHVVMDLTNKIFALETGGQIPTDPQEAMLPTTNQMLEMEINKLKETVEAYKSQNVFLSQEIMELNDIRTSDAEHIKHLNGNIHDLEAELIKVKSKYVILLKESQNPRSNHDSDHSDVVSQMMQEAIDQEANTAKGRSSSEAQYDLYGFKHEISPCDARPNETLDSYAKRLDQQALLVDEYLASQTAKWDNFMTQFPAGKELLASDELKMLIRGGIPKHYKGRVWKYCIKRTIIRRYIPGLYQQLLADNAGKTSLPLNQIELDLLRTLPNNKYYNNPDAPGIPKLRRVLVAYSWYDTDVGYCQGLNRLAAIALLFLEEEDAFWCLVSVVLHLLPPDYYNISLLGSQTDQKVLREFISEKMSSLGAHLDTCDIDFSLITFNWFHTLFIDNLPIETTLRIWDTFLYEGSKVLFRYAMAIFKYNEESLMEQENSIQIFNRLRTIAQDAVDVNRLTQIAFYDPMMRNFSKKKIEQRRSHYRTIIEAEMQVVDEKRAKRRAEDKGNRFSVVESEDDD